MIRTGVLALLVMAAAAPGLAQSPPAEDGPIKAEQFYHNLQVFTGMPAEQVMPAMYFFASALGVDCDFCHKEERTIDLPMKNVARRMIQMTAAINNGSFDGGAAVSCYTCHRGSAHPPSSLPADDAAHFAPARTAALGSQVGPMPSATELLARYETALGGAAALDAVKTLAATGTATDIDGHAVPLELIATASERLIVRQRPTTALPSVYTGNRGWLVDYANHLRQMRLDEVDAARIEHGIWSPAVLRRVLSSARVAGREPIDGRDTFAIVGRTAYLPVVRLNVDADTGLLRRVVYYTEAGVGRFPLQFDIEQYRTVAGVKLPSKWVVTEIRRRRWTYQLDTITPNAAIDAARFVMPKGHEEHAQTTAAVATPAAPKAAPPPAPAPPPTETVATAIPGVIAGGTTIALLKTGLSGTEGPLALPDGSLIFTEREANRITRIDASGAFSTYLENPNGTNSLTLDRTGRLLAVQWITPRVVALTKDGEQVVADRFDGAPFVRPNDIVADASGGVYFTDPGPQPPAKRAVYYVTPAGTVTLVTDAIEFPNGVALSPDERTLYVADTAGEYVIAFDRHSDGSVGARRNFARLQGPPRPDGQGVRGGADGLAVDAAGRLYAATTAGVQVFSPAGEPLGVIPIGLPAGPQNLAFAGPDKKMLYVVGRGAAYRVPMLAAGYAGRAK